MYNFDYSKLPIKNIQKIFPIAGGYVNLSFSVDASNKKYFFTLQQNPIEAYLFYFDLLCVVPIFHIAGVSS